MMEAQSRRIGRSSYVTPRHYLDLIKHFVALFGEKREELEDQQRHLNTGLRKLKETEEEVNVRQAALNVKQQELQEMDRQANEKLSQITTDELKANERREESLKIQKEIDVQQAAINERAVIVQGELAQAGPMLEAAQKAVQGVRRQDLTEIANLLNPPALVKLAVGAVFTLMGQAKLAKNWKDLRKSLRKADFIKNVLEFDTEQITAKTRNRVFGDYIEKKEWEEAKIMRASKACGPLAKWVYSQVNYAKILQSVEPLRNEVKELSEKANKLQAEQADITKTIKHLEASITSYKGEYKVLITQTEKIRIEMEDVKGKVERSIQLLRNLTSERDRWTQQSHNFRQQLTTIVGDCLLSAAFITYVGWFDHTYRRFLLDRWRGHLLDVDVVYQDNLVMSEYLSRPSQRLKWKESALPDDELCVENAVMLQRFNRYPLVIDPSGQATQFIMNEFKERKITRTSFLDASFLKSLESALRFGNALLVDDVESLDPVLNSVLNREIQRVGGRVLIRVGDKDIDFSPKFVIFLCTRDPTCHFTPDLCSRVTFVNFSVTPSSLRSQCLSQILLAEQPEIDKKRNDLLRIQGEFRVRLRALEDQLLDALNEVKGNILDDDKIIGTLETLKKESAEINKKMAETETVMEEVSEVSAMYSPFALSCSRIYFSMESLGIVSFLYQFSLTFFLQIIDDVLQNKDDEELKEQPDAKSRLEIIALRLYENVFARVSRGLLQKDHISFAMRLSQIRLESSDEPIDKKELDFFIRGKVDTDATLDGGVPVRKFGFSSAQVNAVTQLLALQDMGSLTGHLTNSPDDWKEYIDAKTDECPSEWQDSMSDMRTSFQQMLVQKVFRPDRIMTSSSLFVSDVFNSGFLSKGADVDLGELVKTQVDCNSPLLLVGTPGNDPSGKIEALGSTVKAFQSFAMGSPDGYEKADSAVSSAAKKGTWILLKNVHLSPSWLISLEKKLHRLEPNRNFRLFLTMEINPKVPATLLRKSYVVIFEPPAGIKSSLARSYANIPAERIDREPAERSRLYVLLAWLHAVVLERLRYTPVGWSKGFEFSETDQRCAMDAMDEWIDRLAGDRSHIDPSSIPWLALQVMLEQYVYGGRIDNQFDNERLSGFVRHLFSAESFNANFALTKTFGDSVVTYSPTLPDNTNYLSIKRWIQSIDDVAILSPTLLGLPANAERMLLMTKSQEMLKNLLYLQEVEEEDDADDTKDDLMTDGGISGDVPGAPQWMSDVLNSIQKWTDELPDTNELTELPRAANSVKNPLYRSLGRELSIGKKCLKAVKSFVVTLQSVVDGKEKATNELRAILKPLRDELIPKAWSRFYSVQPMTVSLWLADFGKRVKQLQFFCNSKYVDEPTEHIWLGGLFSPEAYVSATRQSVAQRNGWPLEQLVLEVYVGRSDDDQTMNTFVFDDLRMSGARWDQESQCLRLSDESATTCPPAHFEWKLKKDSKQLDNPNFQVVDIPVYLNSGLQNLLFSVKLPCPIEIPKTTWSQRGACFTVWSN